MFARMLHSRILMAGKSLTYSHWRNGGQIFPIISSTARCEIIRCRLLANQSYTASEEQQGIIEGTRNMGITPKQQRHLIKQKPVKQREDTEIVKVAIIGAPNAGKSTLTNQLLGWKIAPVSRRVHTTRERTLGALTQENKQVIFLDTPGLIVPGKVKKHNLERTLLTDPHSAIEEADLIAVVVDVSHVWHRAKLDLEILKALQLHLDKKSILILNKVDLIKDKQELLNVVRTLTDGVVDGVRDWSTKREKQSRVNLKQLFGRTKAITPSGGGQRDAKYLKNEKKCDLQPISISSASHPMHDTKSNDSTTIIKELPSSMTTSSTSYDSLCYDSSHDELSQNLNQKYNNMKIFKENEIPIGDQCRDELFVNDTAVGSTESKVIESFSTLDSNLSIDICESTLSLKDCSDDENACNDNISDNVRTNYSRSQDQSSKNSSASRNTNTQNGRDRVFSEESINVKIQGNSDIERASGVEQASATKSKPDDGSSVFLKNSVNPDNKKEWDTAKSKHKDLSDRDSWNDYYKKLRRAEQHVREKKGWQRFSRVFMVSAMSGDGVTEIKDYFLQSTHKSDWLYHPSLVTDQNPIRLAKLCVWEKLLEHLPDEIPYQITVKLCCWEMSDESLWRASFDIICPEKRHLRHVLGPDGKTIRKIASESKQELMNAFRRDLSLRLVVKGSRSGIVSDAKEGYH